MAVEDSSFPRGGSGPVAATGSKKANVTSKGNLFDQMQKKKVTKTKTKKKKQNRVVTGAQPQLLALEDLSYRVLKEGMNVLGRITEITDYYLHVSLPGLTAGRVPVTQISEPYSKLLQSAGQYDDDVEALCPLSELFYKGQLVTAQVWQIRQSEDLRHHVSLSLSPNVVHADWSHTAMAKKGLIINAAVKSKEEHGYVMDCGVSGLRSFLSEDKASNYCNTFNGGRPLAIGQVVRCIVTKADASSTASKVELSADPEDVAEQEEIGHQSLDMQLILPGMRFKLTVSEHIQDGMEVKFHGLCGYIHRNHLSDHELELEPGTTVYGRVLYITPLVKNVYLSALPDINSIVREIPKPSPAEVHFKIGDIVDSGKVTGVGGKGLFLQLGNKNLKVRGFVPERRIGFNFKGKLADNDDDSTMLQRLRTKFPLGSSVRCRLLYFDIMSGTYICSMEKSVLDEKYLSYSDVKVGDVVSCVVDEVRQGGIAIKVGMLSGFVPAVHSADVPLIHPARRFQPDTRVTGRVLKVDLLKNRLIVTLKKSLVSSDSIISSYQSARVGLCYPGTVVALTTNGVIVSFFGDVKGYLENTSRFVLPNQSFSIGQLIKCYVVKRNNEQLRLSMVAPTQFVPNDAASSNVKIGQMYNLEVHFVSGEGLSVKVTDKGDSLNASGIIPVYHLSDDIEMAKCLLNTFEVGTVLTNVWCFAGQGPKRPVVFSMRSSVTQFFKSIRGQIASKKSIEALSAEWVLPCSISKVHPDSLLIQVPLSSVKSLIKVRSQQVCDEGETIESLGYVEGQAIQAKILKVLENNSSLVLECRKSQVYKDDYGECSIMHLSKHLSDQQRLLAHAKRMGNPLGAYKIGSGVSGVVSERTEWGFVLRLDNGARGETTFFNANSDDLPIGSRVKGKVLHVDCIRGHVEITLRKDIRLNLKSYNSENLPTLELDVQLRGPTLLATPEFILVQLKGAGKFNLAYIPTRLYPYGTSTMTVPEPYFGIDRKVVVKRFTNRIILCLPKELVKAFKRDLKLAEIKKKRLKLQKEKKEKKQKNKSKEKNEKIEKNDRYFNLAEDIKEEEEEEDEEAVSQRIWDTENDGEVIDKDIDEISDDESAELNEYESSSDVESEVILGQTSDDEKENSSQNGLLKARKRKSSAESMEEKEPVSSSKKTKQENGTVDATSSKTKKKRKGTTDNESNSDSIKRLKNGDQNETLDLDSDSEDNSSPQQTNQTLKNPGFMWDIDPAKFMEVLEPGKQDSSSDEDESDDEKSKKKKRKKSAVERREAERLEEERLQKVENELLDPNRQLTSCDDFDRMVLANPDSSSIWLQYMAFHLQATEIEKARAVAQRALKSISYREEQEKLNVWLGLLNLENLYGTAETLKSTLEQALQMNDAYKIRLHMVRLYAESSKNKELESEVRLVVKKFKETPGIWQELGAILMSQGYAEKARSILQQALQSVKNKKESVDLIVHFALLEARNNNLEQAKALMDPILASYPKRTDIWCTYCDLLVKANQIGEARELLERSVSQKLPAKNMKTLFTKFLQFETAHGTKEGQAKVKSMAAEYVKQVGGDEPISND